MSTNKEFLLSVEEAAMNAIVNGCARYEVDVFDMHECGALETDPSEFDTLVIKNASEAIDRVFFLYDTAKTYEVGGCVRDTLMGLVPKDHDYCVVGATPELMLAHGFKQVGADFPVFLHPISGNEYALARIERKSGNGYHGFEVVFDTSVGGCLNPDLRDKFIALGFNTDDDYSISDLMAAAQRIGL